MSDVDVDLKTKYIDITQLPVAEDENSVLTYEHFECFREELDKPNRRYEFEGSWDVQYELGSVEPKWRFIGVDYSPWQSTSVITRMSVVNGLISGYCTPSRNAILTFGITGAT